MHMDRGVGVWVLATVLMSWPMSASARPPRAEVMLKFGTLAPEGTPWVEALRGLDRSLRTETHNAVGLRVYPGGMLGDDPALVRLAHEGRLQGLALTGVGLGILVPWSRVLELPFLATEERAAEALRQALQGELRRDLAQKGWVWLGWLEVGWLHLYTRDPLPRVTALSSRKPWAFPGDAIGTALLDQVGAMPVGGPLGSVRQGINDGRISAVYHAAGPCLALQWCAKLPHRWAVPVALGMGGLLVKTESLGELSEDHRQSLQRLAQAASVAAIQKVRHADREAQQALQRHGVAVTPVSAAGRAEARTLGWKVAAAMVRAGAKDGWNPQLLARVRRAVEGKP